MVTLFSIVIFFPKPHIQYYNFDIVQVPAAPVVLAEAEAPAITPEGTGERLRVPSLDTAPQNARVLYAEGLPAIQLPTLEFGELRRLRVRSESLDASGLDEILGRRRDSWSRLGEGIARVRESITELRVGDSAGGMDATPRPVHRPADGFEAFIEWTAGPGDRQLLFAPPITELWDIEPESLTRPVEVVFEVTPQGRVVNAYSLRLDETGLLDAVQLAVLKYKFEPLPAEAQGNQMATLYITAARGDR
jgi:hypothetical protein